MHRPKPIRVGFDLDGVILYNPARISRPVVHLIKKHVLGKKGPTRFYIPKNRFERFIWHIFHYSSIFVAPGFDQIRALTESGVIEPYLITARYSFLEKDLRRWLTRLDLDSFFKGVYFNKHDEQPHLYKEHLIRELKLDYFVEDNYDIVRHLQKQVGAKVIWIYNIFDRGLQTKLKVPTLTQAISHIKPIKDVLIYSEFYTPHWTGIAKACAQMAQDILKLGHNVTVVTTQLTSSLRSREQLSGITVVRYPYLFKISRTLYSLSTLWRSSSLLRRADVVIINSPHSNIFPLSVLRTMLGKRLVIFHQGDLTLPRKTGNQLLRQCLERIFDYLTIPSMALADTISTYTQDYARHSRVMKRYLHKCVPYIPLSQLSPTPPTDTFRAKMQSIKKDAILIGIAGRFVEEKGFDILLESLPLILKEIPTARVAFAGEMNMQYEQFDSLLADKIQSFEERGVFVPLGLLKENDLNYFYIQLDCFVISSRSDCFPITQIEAALSGIPLVCTDIPGARQLVRQTGFGGLARSEDPKSLARTIIETLRNRSKYLKNKPAAKRFLESFSEPPF